MCNKRIKRTACFSRPENSTLPGAKCFLEYFQRKWLEFQATRATDRNWIRLEKRKDRWARREKRFRHEIGSASSIRRGSIVARWITSVETQNVNHAYAFRRGHGAKNLSRCRSRIIASAENNGLRRRFAWERAANPRILLPFRPRPYANERVEPCRLVQRGRMEAGSRALIFTRAFCTPLRSKPTEWPSTDQPDGCRFSSTPNGCGIWTRIWHTTKRRIDKWVWEI